jgi:hypothetical protein
VTKPDSSPDIDFNVGGPTAASLSEANRQRPAGLSDANRPRPADLADAPVPVPAPASASDTDTDPDSTPEINLDLLPKPEPKPPKPPPKPAPKPAPEPELEPQSDATLLPFVADLGVFLLLVIVGVFAGELLAGKPTGQVLSEVAGPKFPSIDLVLWAVPPLLLGLVYILLNGRERTLGAWLRRRRG